MFMSGCNSDFCCPADFHYDLGHIAYQPVLHVSSSAMGAV